MAAASDQQLQHAISVIAQSDPIVRLLQQVQLGRMKASDSGLRAVTESWLASYQKAVTVDGLTKSALRRLDPAPRIALLIHHGILSPDHSAVLALRASFEQATIRAVE